MPLFGRNDQEDQAHAINGLIQSIISGGYGGYNRDLGLTDPQNLMRYINQGFDTAGQSLYGQQQRTASNMGRLAGGIGASQGINPYALIMRSMNNANDSFANAFGNLNTQRAMSLAQAPLQSAGLNQRNLENLLSLISGRAGVMGGMSQGGGLDSILGNLAGTAGTFGLGKAFGVFGG